MSTKEKTLLATLNGMGFPVVRYPRGGAETISESGFYFNQPSAQIEHWSTLAPWNQILADHSSNKLGMICDGYQSILPFEDLEHMLSSLKVWKAFIDKQGVN